MTARCWKAMPRMSTPRRRLTVLAAALPLWAATSGWQANTKTNSMLEALGPGSHGVFHVAYEKDSRGGIRYVWIATSKGLHQYDGFHDRTFTTKDGLPSDFVRSVLVTRAGKLWVSTNKGAGTFDGSKFSTEGSETGLAGPNVRRIIEDREGTLWFACDSWGEPNASGGLTSLRGGQWRSWHIGDGLPSDYVIDELTDSSGRKFAMTLAGPARLVGERWVKESVPGLTPPMNWGSGTIVEAPGLGLVMSNGWNVWVSRVPMPGATRQGAWVKLGNPPLHQHGLVVTHDNKVLLAGETKTQMRAFLEWSGKEWTRVSDEFHVAQGWAIYLSEAPDGSIWYAGADCLRRWPRLGGEWRFLPGSVGVKQFLDSGDTLWSHAADGALWQFNGTQWLRRGRYTVVAAQSDSVWGISSGAVTRWHKGEETVFNHAVTRVPQPALLDVDGKGVLWLAGVQSDGSLSVSSFDGRIWRNRTGTKTAAGTSILAHTTGPDGGVWYLLTASSGHTLAFVDDSTHLFSVPSTLVSPFSNTLQAGANGEVYLYGETGLHRLKPDKTWETVPGLPAHHIDSMAFSGGQMWVSTDSVHGGTNGLYRRSADGWKFFETEPLTDFVPRDFSQKTGAPILAGSLGRFYIVPPGASAEPLEVRVPGGDPVGSVNRDREGVYWIATTNGLFRFQPDGEPRDLQLDTLSASILSGQPLAATVVGLRRFSAERNPMGFLFAWKLDDGPWSPFTSRFHRQVEGEDLGPGTHRLAVRALDNGSEITAKPAAVTFHVQSQPLQDKPWFVPGLMLATVLMSLSSLAAITAHRKLARQSRQMLGMSELRYRQIVETSREGIATIDENGVCTMLNDEFARIQGHPKEYFLNRHYRDWAAPGTLGDADRLFERKRQGLSDSYEIEILTPNGPRVVAVCERPVPSADGTFFGHLLTITDLTDRKRAENAIRKSEADYRRLFDSSPNPSLLVELETLRILNFNHAACETYGYPPQEFWGMSVLDLQVPEGIKESRQLFAKPAFPGPVFRRHKKKDGTPIDVEIYGEDQEFEGRRCRQILAIDKTRQIQDANRLKESERTLALAQKIAQLGSFRFRIPDATKPEILPEWSDEFYRLLGFDPASKPSPQPSFWSFIHPDDKAGATERARALALSGTPLEFEHRIIRADGAVRFMRTTARLSEADPSYVVGTIQDITDARAMQQQAEQSQRLDSVGRLAGGVAHDFNNLLTVINGFSRLALNKLTPENPLHSDLQQIADAGQEAAELTGRLLAFGRKQTLKPIPLDLNQVIREAAPLLSRVVGEDIHLSVLLSEQPAPVQADLVQIKQVLLNLTTNARDAMPRGGTLTMETALAVLDDAFVEAHPGAAVGSHVRLSVSDTGTGMDAETKKRIFEPFFTTKSRTGGTGLGLATVYGIINQSGGFIFLESGLGTGTAFSIFLPALEGREPVSPIQPSVSQALSPVGGGKLVVLVEDQPDVRQYTAGVLIQNGYRVFQAASGAEARAIVEAFAEPPDLLLTDVVMPGMTGFELVQRLGEKWTNSKPLTVLYMSGYADGKLDAAGAPASGILLLEKPFSPEDLLAHVAQAIQGPSQHAIGVGVESRLS